LLLCVNEVGPTLFFLSFFLHIFFLSFLSLLLCVCVELFFQWWRSIGGGS
jgi:hypothetical protein